MIDSDILSILKKQYNNYSGNLSFEEAVQALSGLVVKQNKAEQLYIHHAEKCGTEVIIPYGIDFIKAGAFRNQTNLKKVDIQARITELQRYTFVYCSQLEEISLPDSLLSIGDGAFEGCTSLEHITIPASVQEIKPEAFLRCKALKEVTLLNPKTVIDEKSFAEGCVIKYEALLKDNVVNSEFVDSETDVNEPVPASLQNPLVEDDVIAESDSKQAAIEENSAVDDKKLTVSHSIKMLFCADVQLGAISTENCDLKQSHKWQETRNEKLADLMDRATQNNAAYVALFGRLFGQERVSESVIDILFKAAEENRRIQTLAFLNEEEYKRISYRDKKPQNFHIFCTKIQNHYTDDYIEVGTDKGIVELRCGDNDSLKIRKNEDGKYLIYGMQEEHVLPSFEPTGFEDAEGLICGFGVLDWTENSFGTFTFSPDQKYAYRAIEIKIRPEDDAKEIERKINNAVRMIPYDTFLRITLTGRSAFGLTLSEDALKNQLQKRIFFVEVYDNTIMDIDEEAFENDISLRSEFVRLALQDDSLSESERNRLISCGWNALNNRGAL